MRAATALQIAAEEIELAAIVVGILDVECPQRLMRLGHVFRPGHLNLAGQLPLAVPAQCA
jgi:hypothetical protein